jgi:hypothetical protein
MTLKKLSVFGVAASIIIYFILTRSSTEVRQPPDLLSGLVEPKTVSVVQSSVAAKVASIRQDVPPVSGSLPLASPKNNADQISPVEDAVTSIESSTKKSEDFSRYSQSLNEQSVSLRDDLQSKFQQEVVDNDWAPFYEEKIRDFFADTKAIDYYVPDSVLCRTKTCQIQLHVANDQELSEAAKLFADTFLAGASSLSKADLLVTPDFDKKILLLYIGKDESSHLYQ